MRETGRRLPLLDERLTAIASLVRGEVPCVDVGCDHGYLITYLAATGKIPCGIACDINKMPLQKAEHTVREYGVEGKVKTLLTDGLAGIAPEDAGEIIIAGMGGELIAQIMEACPWAKSPRHFILQPMTKDNLLREYLVTSGYAIRRECAAISGKFRYTVMSVDYTGERMEHPEEFYLYTGALPAEHTPEAVSFLEHRARVFRDIAAQRAKGTDGQEEASRLLALAERIEAIIKE